MSLVPVLQVIGEPVKSIDSGIARVLPITDSDERKFGESLSKYYVKKTNLKDPDYIYLNEIIANLSKNGQKQFKYKVFVLDSKVPNACALPGGIILVTSGLLNTLDTEAQLASVFAHEMGHIECGHCVSAVKYQLAAKKINMPSLGKIPDFFNRLFFRHVFSKTQENEADEYSYKLLLKTEYNPSATAQSFEKLKEYKKLRYSQEKTNNKTDLLRDYITSHPPLSLRISKFSAEAKSWWRRNSGTKRYNGRENLKNRKSFYTNVIKDEWTG
ncbi:MAG: M48 family metallopeptidase [Candidatus Theseobacter exili]|nr:M48 family metallopeptidase [Candidatus Theseobacter exili]